MKINKQSIRNKLIIMSLTCFSLTATAMANPSDEAKDFAAQFKKAPNPQVNIDEHNQVTITDDSLKSAEQVLNELKEKKTKRPVVEEVQINETPERVELFGEGVPTNYEYIPPTDDEDVSISQDDEFDNGPRFSFDWQGAPLTSVFYAISRISRENIIVVDSDDLSEAKVYGVFNGTAEEIIRELTSSYGLNYKKSNGKYTISKDKDTMPSSQRFLIRYADEDKIKSELTALGIAESGIVVNKSLGTITVTGNSLQLNQAEKLIKSADKQAPQVAIIAQLIETTHTKDLEAGFNYTMPSYTHNIDDPLSHQNWGTKMVFGVTSSLNEAISRGKVLSRPVLATENGQEATVFMGDRVPIPQQTTSDGSTSITFDYQDVGNTLKITPKIDKKSGIVSLNIDAQIKNITKYIQQGGMQAPQIASREAQTLVHLKSGQTFVIGGLMSQENLDTISGIPLLKDLPILGEIFKYHKKNKSNTEVFISITPYILNDGDTPDDVLKVTDNLTSQTLANEVKNNNGKQDK